MYTRPRHIFPEKDKGPGSESTSKPHFMDDLLGAAGAVNVEFPLKTACCGGAHTLSDSDTSTKLVLNILRTAEAAGAEVIATECPTCHSGLEMHQVRAEKKFGQPTKVKILYFTQLLGLALGLVAAAGRRAREHLRLARVPAREGHRVRPLAEIEQRLDALEAGAVPVPAAAVGTGRHSARRCWSIGSRAKGLVPTQETREGFRLLALHRQGCTDDPSFNACRETCRELVYHHNLVTSDPQHPATPQRLTMMTMVARHLFLFVTGKMQVAALGDFCCASRPIRQQAEPQEIG